jgi:hypothetical protein
VGQQHQQQQQWQLEGAMHFFAWARARLSRVEQLVQEGAGEQLWQERRLLAGAW